MNSDTVLATVGSKQQAIMNTKRDTEPAVELECQFILRLPEEPGKALRDMLRSGMSNLKDRFLVRLENDVRYGEVRVDNWLLHAKVVDLPTIVESLKTIDNKSFYKTADICQMMICKVEDDAPTDEESPSKHKKKDPNKVDKKFLHPHGITPPLKNVRKRRFRKTLKKKYVEAPEIEKEVKRLLRGDNEAVSVRWEVINEEDDKKGSNLVTLSGAVMGMPGTSGGIVIKEEPPEEIEGEMPDTNTQTSVDVAEHDIFGEAVSDSDEEESHINIMEEESSRLSAEDSRISDSMSQMLMEGKPEDHSMGEGLITQFSKGMFVEDDQDPREIDMDYPMYKPLTPDSIRVRLDELTKELADIKLRRDQQELEISHIENHALRVRFQGILDSLLQQQLDKEQEFQELSELLTLSLQEQSSTSSMGFMSRSGN
uniref:Transcription initiation factor TFIID subunit 7 n=3 Tax=Lygus hesperus TaxID=30085 RepID=A0A0A9Z880_LYGHE